ncbi:hypothetical protein YC2023_086939 [Brassica napus]
MEAMNQKIIQTMDDKFKLILGVLPRYNTKQHAVFGGDNFSPTLFDAACKEVREQTDQENQRSKIKTNQIEGTSFHRAKQEEQNKHFSYCEWLDEEEVNGWPKRTLLEAEMKPKRKR